MMEKYSMAHRDIKSANILVRGENGDSVIADFGLALILDPASDARDMANTGQVGGSECGGNCVGYGRVATGRR